MIAVIGRDELMAWGLRQEVTHGEGGRSPGGSSLGRRIWWSAVRKRADEVWDSHAEEAIGPVKAVLQPVMMLGDDDEQATHQTDVRPRRSA